MSFLSRWRRSAHGAEGRRNKLIQQLSQEVREHGAETERAKEIQQAIVIVDTPAPPNPFTKQAAQPTRQRIKANLRANWNSAFQAPSDRQSRVPRKERREMARAQAAGQFRKQFQHGSQSPKP